MYTFLGALGVYTHLGSLGELGSQLVSESFASVTLMILFHICCHVCVCRVSEKFPPLNSLQLCEILTNFQIFYIDGSV